MSYIESLQPIDRDRYLKKITLIGSDSCPYLIKEWTNDPTEWPEVSFPDIFCYLVESPGKRQNHVN